MNVIKGPVSMREKTAVALGSFDGLHRGHMALVQAVVEKKQSGHAALVYTFDQHPGNFFRSGPVPLLTTDDIRKEILESMGVDYFYKEQTDPEYWKLKPEEFVESILKDRLKAQWVIVGENYRFGAGAKGDSGLLTALCNRHGIRCQVISGILESGEMISSSVLRQMAVEGEMEMLNQRLGRYFRVQGTVAHGRRVGRTLGFPTANLLPDPEQITPRRGVYAAFVLVDGVWYPSVTNVGIAPTFDVNQVLIESNLLGFEEEIYGKKIKVDFVKYIRGERKFESVDALVAQIALDSQAALEILKGGRAYE